MDTGPKWLTYEQVIALHSRQLRRFGGAAGLRDDGLLRSAIERPINKWHYEHGLNFRTRGRLCLRPRQIHAFVDGNKRIAFMSMMAFLRKNGVSFAPAPAHATKIVWLSPPVR